MNTQRTLTVVIVLQTMMLMNQWLGMPHPPTADAQVPDGGAQRVALLDEQKATNARLDKLIEILTSGKLQVRALPPDEKK